MANFNVYRGEVCPDRGGKLTSVSSRHSTFNAAYRAALKVKKSRNEIVVVVNDSNSGNYTIVGGLDPRWS
jgi:hypothetical protein